MSVSSSLNQCGVWPGMMMTSPLVTRRETPPSIPEPRRLLLLPVGAGVESVRVPVAFLRRDRWSREDHEHGEWDNVSGRDRTGRYSQAPSEDESALSRPWVEAVRRG